MTKLFYSGLTLISLLFTGNVFGYDIQTQLDTFQAKGKNDFISEAAQKTKFFEYLYEAKKDEGDYTSKTYNEINENINEIRGIIEQEIAAVGNNIEKKTQLIQNYSAILAGSKHDSLNNANMSYAGDIFVQKLFEIVEEAGVGFLNIGHINSSTAQNIIKIRDFNLAYHNFYYTKAQAYVHMFTATKEHEFVVIQNDITQKDLMKKFESAISSLIESAKKWTQSGYNNNGCKVDDVCHRIVQLIDFVVNNSSKKYNYNEIFIREINEHPDIQDRMRPFPALTIQNDTRITNPVKLRCIDGIVGESGFYDNAQGGLGNTFNEYATNGTIPEDPITVN